MQKERHNLDAYYTAAQLTQALCDNVLGKFASINNTFLEPCNGIGAISNVLAKNGYRHIARWDIDENLLEDGHIGRVSDASNPDSWKFWKDLRLDWVVSNPPYTQPQCHQIIENSIKHVNCGIAMLLRLSYDEPCKNRVDFLRQNIMSHQIIFNPRPRFRPDTKGSDNVTSCWFVWLTDDFAKKVAITSTEKIYVTDWNK